MAARLADYSVEELAALPDDAVVNSFGCGNPLAFAGVEPGQVVLDRKAPLDIDLQPSKEVPEDETDARTDRDARIDAADAPPSPSSGAVAEHAAGSAKSDDGQGE